LIGGIGWRLAIRLVGMALMAAPRLGHAVATIVAGFAVIAGAWAWEAMAIA
jgi:hypothetical protein